MRKMKEEMSWLAILATLSLGLSPIFLGLVVATHEIKQNRPVSILIALVSILLLAPIFALIVLQHYGMKKQYEKKRYRGYLSALVTALYVPLVLGLVFTIIAGFFPVFGYWPFKEDKFELSNVYIFFIDQTLKGMLFDIAVNFPFELPNNLHVRENYYVFKVVFTAWQMLVTIIFLEIILGAGRRIGRSTLTRVRWTFRSARRRRTA